MRIARTDDGVTRSHPVTANRRPNRACLLQSPNSRSVSPGCTPASARPVATKSGSPSALMRATVYSSSRT